MKVGDKSYLFDVLQADTGVMQQLQAIFGGYQCGQGHAGLQKRLSSFSVSERH